MLLFACALLTPSHAPRLARQIQFQPASHAKRTCSPVVACGASADERCSATALDEQTGPTRAKLVGFENFVRTNPMSDRFDVIDFHHIEFLCGDARATTAYWCNSLGLKVIARSNMLTGNRAYASYVLGSGSVRFVLTAPYGANNDQSEASQHESHNSAETAYSPTSFSPSEMHAFFAKHGVSACAVGLHVGDAALAFKQAIAGGAVPRAAPRVSDDGECTLAEVQLYGDTVLRFVSGAAIEDGTLAFLPGYEKVDQAPSAASFGVQRLDHVVGNVPSLLHTIDYMQGLSGFHEFAEFTAEDVGTVDSGLNSMVLASNNERVLLPVNEPTYGSRRKSQILTYLEQHNGPGVQHIALKTDDIFGTVSAMRQANAAGVGFELMDRPRAQYYENLRQRLGEDALSEEDVSKCQELGILADRDDQGVLLQIFTKPVSDRSTMFFEIIQRVGCTIDPITGKETVQAPGCGGFGKGNFHELFRTIEEYETRAGINIIKR